MEHSRHSGCNKCGKKKKHCKDEVIVVCCECEKKPGPTGPTGIRGPTGPCCPGSTGPTGFGSTGFTGPTGSPGPTGPSIFSDIIEYSGSLIVGGSGANFSNANTYGFYNSSSPVIVNGQELSRDGNNVIIAFKAPRDGTLSNLTFSLNPQTDFLDQGEDVTIIWTATIYTAINNSNSTNSPVSLGAFTNSTISTQVNYSGGINTNQTISNSSLVSTKNVVAGDLVALVIQVTVSSEEFINIPDTTFDVRAGLIFS